MDTPAPPTTPPPGPPPSSLRRKKPEKPKLKPKANADTAREMSNDDLKKALKRKLKLKFTPDDWQVVFIRKILQGYDGVLCAGTGYGKSLIFEGLGALGAGARVVVIISPLKALEHDQAMQASQKGISAVVLNEDTVNTRGIWEKAKTTASMVYCSPEMAMGTSFNKLWTSGRFRERLTAVIVDEAHCVEEWGDDDFRPQYRELERLRTYTGQDVPFVACTATCTTSTFDLLWDSLGFGYRPFWGLDVGVERPNLFFQINEIENHRYPLLDILNIFPAELTEETTRAELPKSFLYFDTEGGCREAVQFVRKLLPQHLRDAVQPFSSSLSAGGKEIHWNDFLEGNTQVLCATDAAGMGCNIPDVEYVISFGIPKSVGQVYQRWGRTGRNRVLEGTCLLLVPSWAIRPQAPLNPLLAKLSGVKAIEPKQNTVKRANLPSSVEEFVNLPSDTSPRCIHQFTAKIFRPSTRLDTYHSLEEGARRVLMGKRSRESPHDLRWVVLNAGRSPPPDRCCAPCNPAHPKLIQPCSANDPRLQKFAADFIYPPVHTQRDHGKENHSTPTANECKDEGQTKFPDPSASGMEGHTRVCHTSRITSYSTFRAAINETDPYIRHLSSRLVTHTT